ncbi:MAG: methyl-accepting chemotaxis protein [Oscillospiraceae bacterium]|nr:methyl-accepting chemotaxis protein [Oscillospiraceae bacterium]
MAASIKKNEINTSVAKHRKTTIRARIVRLSVVGILAAIVTLTVFYLFMMYTSVSSSSKSEIEMLTISYSSAISNADITKNKNYLNDIFTDFDKVNTYGGFGFVSTETGSIISETSVEVIKKGDTLSDKAAEDSGYSELAALVNTLNRNNFDYENIVKQGQSIVSLCGEKYLIGWANIENFDTCYTFILLPYKNIMKPFTVSAVIALSAAVIFIAVSICVSVNAAKKITKPITDAIDRLTALSKGDLESPSPVTDRNDETLILLDSLNETIKSLNAYITDIRSVLSAVADGNLLVSSGTVYTGDFEAIRHALDRICSSLNGTFSEVHRAALSVKECSVHVSDGTEALCRNSSAEAGTMQELTASIARINEKIKENAHEAENARDLTVSADKAAEEGSGNMRAMIEAIKEIETSASEIEKIINVIDDIAFQTNILALNAAVEAARAGDAGKGFAVVADEVRNLANKSAEAAAQTGQLIRNSIDSVNNGTALADAAAKSLENVVEMVSSVSDIVDRIAVSAGEQAESVARINSGMEAINGSIRDNSVTAEKNAEVSKELSDQFDNLNRHINRFKFKA